MRTKERLSATVRLLCFGILLVATAIRLGTELYERQPAIAATTTQPTENIYPIYPTIFYEPPAERTRLTFQESDTAFAPIDNWSGIDIDAGELIARATNFELSDEPMILIVHTHATEAYCQTPGARTTDTSQNVVHIGQLLAQTLNENGINTLHDTTLIDESGYYDAYSRAAEIIEGYLGKYPSIQMVIDVHRDSITDENGDQIALHAQIEDTSAAQLMFVMGTNTSGLYHPNWQENLSFALKLQALCEKEAQGLFRDLNLRSQRSNQHLTPHSLLIEVGSAGNTLQEAETSIRYFAQQLSKLLLGAEVK